MARIVDRLANTLARARREGRQVMSFQLSDDDMLALRASRDPRVVIGDEACTFEGFACVLGQYGQPTKVILRDEKRGAGP